MSRHDLDLWCSRPLLFGQLLLGLINGAFYAMLSLGLAVIFGMLEHRQFAHGALFMIGAFVAWIAADVFRDRILARRLSSHRRRRPFGVLDGAHVLQRLYGLDPLYGLLLTFGVALILEGFPRRLRQFGALLPPCRPLQGATNLGFMFLPN